MSPAGIDLLESHYRPTRRLRLALMIAGIVLFAVGIAGCPSAAGGERQPCYGNGTCDEGLTCASDICVRIDGGDAGPDGDAPASTDVGVGLDAPGADVPAAVGCTAIDVLFAIEHQPSLATQRMELSNPGRFTAIVESLEALGAGASIRVGVTDENDGGFVVPSGWSGSC